MYSTTNPSLRTYYINGDGVRLRGYIVDPNGPHPEEGVLGQLYEGDSVDNITNADDKYFVKEYDYTWVYVRVLSAKESSLVGKEGYVASQYLSSSKPD